jgi:hypothetical protein
VQSLAHLRELNLWGLPNLSMETLAAILAACKEITSLNLRFVLDVTDDDVKKIVEALPRLEELDLGYDMLVSAASLAHLAALPNLKSLGLKELYLIKSEDIETFKTQQPQCAISDRA